MWIRDGLLSTSRFSSSRTSSPAFAATRSPRHLRQVKWLSVARHSRPLLSSTSSRQITQLRRRGRPTTDQSKGYAKGLGLIDYKKGLQKGSASSCEAPGRAAKSKESSCCRMAACWSSTRLVGRAALRGTQQKAKLNEADVVGPYARASAHILAG